MGHIYSNYTHFINVKYLFSILKQLGLDATIAVKKLEEFRNTLKSEAPGQPFLKAAVEKAMGTICEKTIEDKLEEIQNKILDMAEREDQKSGRALSNQTTKVFQELFIGNTE